MAKVMGLDENLNPDGSGNSLGKEVAKEVKQKNESAPEPAIASQAETSAPTKTDGLTDQDEEFLALLNS
mgnify:FL=1